MVVPRHTIAENDLKTQRALRIIRCPDRLWLMSCERDMILYLGKSTNFGRDGFTTLGLLGRSVHLTTRVGTSGLLSLDVFLPIYFVFRVIGTSKQ